MPKYICTVVVETEEEVTFAELETQIQFQLLGTNLSRKDGDEDWTTITKCRVRSVDKDR